jgi:phosphatidylglycerophosphatase C
VKPFQQLDAGALLDRLTAMGGGPDAALCFDADGTLWSGDVGEDMFEFALENRLLRTDALPHLHGLAQLSQLELEAEANAQARSLLHAFRQGALPERAACEMMALGFAGWEPQALSEQIERALNRAQLGTRLFNALAEVFAWAKASGTQVYVISASPDFVVHSAVVHWGLSPEQVAACAPSVIDGRLSSQLGYPLPYAEDKVRAARKLMGSRRWLASFGDSGFDRAMLEAASIGIATRPKMSLQRCLPELPTVYVLAE